MQTALTVAARRLPIEMTTPPFFRKVNPGDFAILYISLVSATLPLSTVDDYGEITLAQQISQLPGVAQVQVFGAQKFAVRVQVDPVAAASRGISLDDVRNVVAKANSNTPVGTIAGVRQDTTLMATAAMRTAADYRDVVVAFRNGSPIKLTEIANVIDSVENDKIASAFNGERAVVLAIFRQPDANTVKVVDMVREHLPAYRAQVPAAVKMEVLNDRSISIRDSVHDVQVTLAIAVSLVVLVIFLFLRKLSATIIPALAVPISLIATCAAMYAFGFSINNMTMLALTLSVGFVVDDAIVMLENIVRHVEGGMRPFEAALKGSREIGFTIVSITFSLIAVFIPVLLMGGMVGRVFREFAVTIAVAIVLSGFVSLTLTPMLCARVLKVHHEGERENFILAIFESMFKALLRAYESDARCGAEIQVRGAGRHDRDDGRHRLSLHYDPEGLLSGRGYRLHLRDGRGALGHLVQGDVRAPAARLPRSCRQDPAVDYVNSTVGTGGPNPTNNTGRLFIALKPLGERERVVQVIQRLRRTANAVTGMRTSFQPVQNINITGRISKSEFQYTLQSSDTEALYAAAPQMRDKIATIEGLRDVTTDLYIKNPQKMVDIDRAAAAIYGVSVDQIHQELFNCFGNRQVATIYTASADYQVILECDPRIQADVSGLSKIFLKTNISGGTAATPAAGPGAGINGNGVATGPAIPLSAVTKITDAVGPLQVNHQGQQPAVTISFNLAPGYVIGQATDAIKQIERESNLPPFDHDRIPGCGAGVRGFEEGADRACVGCDFCGLRDIRHPLRELHPSHHDHLGLAVGGRRRADHADVLPDGPLGHRDDRNRDAGRHREEERDHDGRLRDRATQGRSRGGSRDPRSLPAALPSDHDDDVRGDLRRLADRSRHRRRRRAAPAARGRGRGRAVPFAIADALHHAGRLSLSRPHRSPAQASAGAAARGSPARAGPAGGRGGVVPLRLSRCGGAQ